MLTRYKKRKIEEGKKEKEKKDDKLELPYLPIEIWIKIASSGSPQLWYNMALAIPGLGRYSLRPHIQQRMKAKFVKKTIETCYYGYTNVQWRLPNGKLHSPTDDQPAFIQYYQNKSKWYEEWCKDGKLHRLVNDQPAKINYYDNGPKESEWWYVDGISHRENDQPAIVYYYENGLKWHEWWYKDGELIKSQKRNGRYKDGEQIK